ncbi:hypothetical protein P9314_00130 [Paenibacillus validus]|uniref:Uncharacterized protein n=1 Tax=Paenibacillus validus TaxID=44253 RepID=A0A7X2ZDH1_9BACL|nr:MULTISPECIES: hypothetical protein [Paenibacillus]MED4599120.1 hypothetical protein [Paenibacillus validus]MED4605403.1 hypothetical protein [Paenibacillus validus]MUG72320.1 hypothetical protein [Paenibacillus validus]
MMNHTRILYNNDQAPVQVNLVGTDEKLIPALLSALKNNKITLSSIQEAPVRIDLFSSEAFLYSSGGDKYRIPIF